MTRREFSNEIDQSAIGEKPGDDDFADLYMSCVIIVRYETERNLI